MDTEVAPRDIVDRNRPAPVVEWRGCDAKDCSHTRAYYFASKGAHEIAYCVHHANRFEVNILSQGFTVRDLRYLLAEHV